MQSHAISIQYVSSCNSTLGSILTSTPSADDLADTVVAPRQGAPRELPRMLNDEEGEAESVLQPQSRVLQPQPRILQVGPSTCYLGDLGVKKLKFPLTLGKCL
jgi:hypothetical protein